jgi:hypothetical protein
VLVYETAAAHRRRHAAAEAERELVLADTHRSACWAKPSLGEESEAAASSPPQRIGRGPTAAATLVREHMRGPPTYAGYLNSCTYLLGVA